MTVRKLSRRAFLVGVNLSLGGLALGLYGRADADEPSGAHGPKAPPGSEAIEDRTSGLAPNAFVHVATDGLVTIVIARSEMGQGVRSSIPRLMADELGADMGRVVVQQAIGHPRYGDQNTDGSTSIRGHHEHLRRAAATARTMLIAAAAKRWKVDPRTCTATGHAVVHGPSKRSLGFGELADAADKLPVPKPDKVALRPRGELAVLQEPRPPLLDGDAIVTGTATFGADVRVEGMLIAVIA